MNDTHGVLWMRISASGKGKYRENVYAVTQRQIEILAAAVSSEWNRNLIECVWQIQQTFIVQMKIVR